MSSSLLKKERGFQYISCYSLSFSCSQFRIARHGFNTSHVTLYPLWLNFRRLSQKSFNTSHVTLYLEVHDKQKHCRSFNTSHVTLYRCPNRTHSGHYGRFNTSHVTLYPMERRIAETVNKFQYISCYSLSQSLQFLRLDPVVSIHLMLLFIWFGIWFRKTDDFVSIHLMLLFIGKYSTIIVLFSCFNTSHVTLYHKTIWRESYGNSFQYISCYSLSISGIRAESPGSVSIHLMLLFIILGKYSTKEKTSFNTSHVTLYLHDKVDNIETE